MGLKSVLFVCCEDVILSQTAEAFARLHGSDRLQAYSAGVDPDQPMPMSAVDVMRERGCDLSANRARAFIDLPDITYDFLITMNLGVECGEISARHKESWDVPKPKPLLAEELATVRDEIEMRVVDLIARLKG